MKKFAPFVLSVALFACSSEEQPGADAAAPQMPPSTVILAKPEAGVMVESLTIAGSLNANQSALISAEIAGIIEKVGVSDGQTVNAGDLLFAINQATLSANQKRAEANVQLRLEEKKRVESLFSRKVVSQNDVDKATAELLTAEADLDYAKAQMAKSQVRAPFNGVVGIRQVNKGAYVQEGTPLIQLVELNPLVLDFAAPETVLATLDVGQDVDVFIPALQQSLLARISAIEPQLNAVSRSVRIRASVDNDSGKLRPGLFARVSLPIRQVENILWVPEGALFYQGDSKLIMISDEGKSLRKEVQIAGFDKGRVAVVSGIAANDDVVVAGHHKMPFDGMPMMTVEKPAENSAETPAESSQP